MQLAQHYPEPTVGALIFDPEGQLISYLDASGV